MKFIHTPFFSVRARHRMNNKLCIPVIDVYLYDPVDLKRPTGLNKKKILRARYGSGHQMMSFFFFFRLEG